jgi:hypothetical protein
MDRVRREAEAFRRALDADPIASPAHGAIALSSASGVARWFAWVWAGLAVCVATIPFLPGLTGSRVFFVRDLSMVFWGRYLWLRHELLSGSFPLWDPYMGAGQSAVADALHQLFLLPALAVRLIGSDRIGFNLWIATPFPLAALGAWLFFRRRFTADASALGAIAFSLSGPILSTGNFPNLSWSAAAIPWVLWAIDRVATAATPRRVGVLAVATALQAFAGEPVTLLATLVVGLAFAAMVSVSPEAPFARRARLMMSVALGLGLGLGVAAVQLVPLGHAAALSERSTTIARDFWSLHPVALIEMVSLHMFGDFFTSQNSLGTPWLMALNSGREPLLFSLYFGVPLLAVALFGLVSGGSSRWTLFWIGAGAVSLLSAFGAYTPVYPFVRDHLPLLPSLRFPAKYLVICSIVVAAGAAAGWEAMARVQAPNFTHARVVAIWLPLTIGALGWVAAGACMYFPTPAAFWIFELARSVHVADPVAAAAAMLRTLPHAASWLLVLSVATALLIFAGARTHKRAAAARAALCGLIVVDLLVNAWGVNPTLNVGYLAEPAWLTLTHAHPDSRFYVGSKKDGTVDALDLDWPGPYLNPPGLLGSASRAALSSQLNFDPSGWRSREMLSSDMAVLWPQDFAATSKRFFLGGRFERDLFLDRTGVRYRVLPRREAGGRTPAAVPVLYVKESFLYDYGSDVAPRVMVVSNATVVGDTGEQIEALFTPGWDIRSAAIIEREPPAAGDVRPPVPASATITTDTANRVVVEAGVGEAGGYVVMLDSFSEDWRATADGQPAALVRANGLFRAVRLNPGPHLVEFRYRPRAFLIGAAASAAALAMVLALFVWPVRKALVNRT